jgi:tetratricopeptide (TPR) repeat protein
LFGYGGNCDNGEVCDAPLLTREGWERFEAGSYQAAIDKFNKAIECDGSYSDAYNGRGWAQLRLDLLDEALASFDECLTLTAASADPYAGRAPAYRDLEPPRFADAVTTAAAALAMEPRYRFAHDESFDWQDLRLLKAQSHFALNQFDLAVVEVDSLGGKEIDPESATFTDDLAAEIERLGSLYGG